MRCLWLGIFLYRRFGCLCYSGPFVYVEGDGWGFLSSELGDSLPECVCNLQMIK